MSKRVADVLIETLQAAGVKNGYGIVGDTLNRIAHAIEQSEIDWVHMRHEEAGAFAAQAEVQLTGRLTACAGSCGPGSLHFPRLDRMRSSPRHGNSTSADTIQSCTAPRAQTRSLVPKK
jgi:glyoxylate carboligase